MISTAQACRHYIDEVSVNLLILQRPFLECDAADKAELAIFDRKYRCRTRPAIDHGEVTDNCAGTEQGQDPLFAFWGGDNDFEQTALKSIAALARLSADKKRLAGLQPARFRALKE